MENLNGTKIEGPLQKKLKIAILHHDLEPAELKFREMFQQKGCFVDFLDIRNISEEHLLGYDFVFNRVYSSVASRDYIILNKTLCFLKFLEDKGIFCANSFKASLADYNKFELFNFLSKFGIPTPPTIFVSSRHAIEKHAKEAISNFGLPIVVKRNCGGKSYQVTRAHSFEELIQILNEMFDLAEEQKYYAGFILQKFIKSIKDHDCRVGVVNGEFVFSYARSYIARNSEDRWMSSTSGGSYEFPYLVSEAEKDIAIKASLAIGACFSESDIIFTEDGPYVIEVNPSPGYFVDSFDDLERMDTLVNKLLDSLNPLPKSNTQEIQEVQNIQELEVYY